MCVTPYLKYKGGIYMDFTTMTPSQVGILLACIFGCWALYQVGQYLSANKENIIKSLSAYVSEKYIREALEIVDDVVFTLKVDVADPFKESAENGKLTEEKAKEITNLAVEKIMSRLSDGARNAIEMAFGDLEQFLVDKIKKSVEAQKSGVVVQNGETVGI